MNPSPSRHATTGHPCPANGHAICGHPVAAHHRPKHVPHGTRALLGTSPFEYKPRHAKSDAQAMTEFFRYRTTVPPVMTR